MRNTVMVTAIVFLVLLVIHVALDYGGIADEAATLIGVGKDILGFALAVSALLYLRWGGDRAGTAT